MKISDLKNKKIAILGYGLEGKSTEKFLKKIGINDFVILDKSINENYLDNLGSFDLIFKTPGISPYNIPKLQKYQDKLISQLEIFSSNYDGKIIGITGTKGKSTTSTLLYKILKELGYNVKLVGNIGNPVLDEIDILSGENYDYVIYELSSYMLEGVAPKLFIGLLNNLYNCHLDWHDGKTNYSNAKFNILKNAENKLAGSELINILENKFTDVKYFGNYLQEFGIKSTDIYLKGEHNYKNISGILNILKIINSKFDLEKVKKILATFVGLPHRQELVGEFHGITFINDAIATTPESTIAAMKTFGEKIGTIFIGNEDSGFDLNELKQTIKKFKIKNIVLFPTTGEKLLGDFSKDMNFNEIYPNPLLETGKVYKTLSMEKAVHFAYENTKVGEIVLLSTGAPSFNANGKGIMPWKGYVEKGEMFKKYVLEYSKKLNL